MVCRMDSGFHRDWYAGRSQHSCFLFRWVFARLVRHLRLCRKKKERNYSDHRQGHHWAGPCLAWPRIRNRESGVVDVSSSELACQWCIFWLSAEAVSRSLCQIATSTSAMRQWRPRKVYRALDSIHEPTSTEDSVPTFIIVPGLLIVITLACTIMKAQYSIPVLETLLALVLASLYAMLAVLATGVTGAFAHP